MKKSTLKKEP